MKKIIPLILVIAILAGLGYFFLANDLAMTTLISQDKGRIAKTYNRSVKGINKKTAFNYTLKEEAYHEGEVETTVEKQIKIVYTNDEVSKMFLTVTRPNEEMEVYYEVVGAVATTYITRTPIDKTGATVPTPVRELHTDYTPDYILDTLVDAKPVFMQVGSTTTKTTLELLKTFEDTTKEQHAQTKSSMVMSFSPFYIGAKFTNKSTVEGVEHTFEAVLDVTGKLKNTSIKIGSASEYTRETTTFNSYNKRVKIYWKNHILFEGLTDPCTPSE